MGEKPKIIRDKLKDKIMIFGHFLKPKKKKKEEKKQNEKIIKNKIIRDIRTLFQQEGGCYEPKRVSNFWNNNYIKYESNGHKNKKLSLVEYLPKIKPYLRNIIITLQNSDAWKIQLTIAINIISSKDEQFVEVEGRVMHSNSGNIQFVPYSDANDVIDKLFKSLCSIYPKNLETSMEVQLQLYQFNYCITNVTK